MNFSHKTHSCYYVYGAIPCAWCAMQDMFGVVGLFLEFQLRISDTIDIFNDINV